MSLVSIPDKKSNTKLISIVTMYDGNANHAIYNNNEKGRKKAFDKLYQELGFETILESIQDYDSPEDAKILKKIKEICAKKDYYKLTEVFEEYEQMCDFDLEACTGNYVVSVEYTKPIG